MKIIGVIPARYKSSRFPGKPLVDICGKPMIYWVYRQAMKVKEFDEVYIATDDERIRAACDQYGMKVIMTSDKHNTGSDRVAEVAEKTEILILRRVMEKMAATKEKNQILFLNILLLADAEKDNLSKKQFI